MIQIIQAPNVGIAYLEEKFGLQLTNEEQFFTECLEYHLDAEQERCYLDRVKSNYLSLIKQRPILEELAKMVVLSPLLDLVGFYRPPFYVETEESVEIRQEDEGEVVKGRIDVLVLKHQFWLLVIESKSTVFSLHTAIPQALAYMLSNPYLENPVFGLVTNGSEFIFLKLLKHNIPQYALSEQFTLLQRENELYKVLGILKNIRQVLS
ncbi:restriction endonuclease subunit R [Gloeocapsopsis crepidinum LEGE 06123]|uniref:Restriction endonuclease subunit R n=1 Tax=Gloeocapsopsis crepidinum LEGE 06123 TaxID=588587 RepID=A0ABR9UX81_9CHRO|nr:type I restriction endonuclease [Gloeocapsopsis crepidinum]MBE9192891.1 restriction endonuclease subunit R [Gloeocapsopsis crepidinum LEGE 06123]